MSSTPTLVTRVHFEYIAAHAAREDEFLSRLRREAGRAGIPEISICPEQGAFMQVLLRLVAARRVVEVGTLAGYSAIVMARALPAGGRVRTIELSKMHADFAEAWIAASEVADRIEVLRGDARQVLPRLASEEADAVFLDADKAGYPMYLREAARLLRRGGLVMVDNAFAFGQLFDAKPSDPETQAVREFNELMARSVEFQSVIVPLGDGCWVGVRR